MGLRFCLGLVALLLLFGCDDQPDPRARNAERRAQGLERTERTQPTPRRRADGGRVIRDGGINEPAFALAGAPPTLEPTADFTVAEPHEAYPGGAASARGDRLQDNPLSQAVGNLPQGAADQFRLGRQLFRVNFTETPEQNRISNFGHPGLGPVFNAASCVRCHRADGRGRSIFVDRDGAPLEPRRTRNGRQRSQLFRTGVALLIRTAGTDGIDDGAPVIGFQMQDMATNGVNGEGELFFRTITTTAAEGTTLRRPEFVLQNPPSRSGILVVSPRATQTMTGLGLLEAVPESYLLALADPDDADGDGISGRPHWVENTAGQRAIGRFGWKAGKATVRDQSTGALFFDMGIATTDRPGAATDCTEAQTACLAAAIRAADAADRSINDPELSDADLAALVVYASNLAPPQRADTESPAVLRGKALFYKVGCVSCHTPKLPTADANGHLGGHVIWPYTDLLLHDMGEELADGFIEGDAQGTEWRTPPLWGIGLATAVTRGAGYLHDSRATTLREAILWHGGEAEATRQQVEDFTEQEWDDLLAFIRAL